MLAHRGRGVPPPPRTGSTVAIGCSSLPASPKVGQGQADSRLPAEFSCLPSGSPGDRRHRLCRPRSAAELARSWLRRRGREPPTDGPVSRPAWGGVARLRFAPARNALRSARWRDLNEADLALRAVELLSIQATCPFTRHALAHGCARAQALAVPRLQASAKSALAASMSPFIL